MIDRLSPTQPQSGKGTTQNGAIPPTEIPFSDILKQHVADMAQLVCRTEDIQKQRFRKKKQVDEASEETGLEEPGLAETVQELSKTLRKLAYLERQRLGL